MSAIKVFMGCGWDKELVLHWEFFLKESKSNSLASYLIFPTFMSYFLHFEANV
jgi:hypothetical protein